MIRLQRDTNVAAVEEPATRPGWRLVAGVVSGGILVFLSPSLY